METWTWKNEGARDVILIRGEVSFHVVAGKGAEACKLAERVAHFQGKHQYAKAEWLNVQLMDVPGFKVQEVL